MNTLQSINCYPNLKLSSIFHTGPSYDVSFKLDEDFTEDLKNPNSQAYKDLVAKSISMVRV